MIGKHVWEAQILDVIRYVLILQHPSDLEEPAADAQQTA